MIEVANATQSEQCCFRMSFVHLSITFWGGLAFLYARCFNFFTLGRIVAITIAGGGGDGATTALLLRLIFCADADDDDDDNGNDAPLLHLLSSSSIIMVLFSVTVVFLEG